MPDKAIELAERLTELDNDSSCPLCEKIEYGAEHSDNCPFEMAYAMLDALDDESKGRDTIETNKMMALRWIEVFNMDDGEHATAIRPYWNGIANFKLQMLVGEQWHDVEIERNPELIDGEGG
ncbi:hypothetical protein LCGC14_2961830 [marine sediment metagenome]|uniref:Uncharacterized protein n=1 Tax=marine sediment metagenome TaxID=412755 RepID=A0A0F9A3A6_9ZZZZ